MASKKALTKPKADHKWWTLVVVCAATFMLLLDITIVNVALPPIRAALHGSFSDLQWVIDAYSLTLATIVLNAGSLADRYGRKKMFMLGVVLFTAASVVCGAATSPLMLILSRAVQGIGGGVMFATSLSLLAQDFHGRDRGLAFGFWGAITGVAVAIGPLVGGELISVGSWRWIFLVNLPIGALTLLAAWWRIHESRNISETKTDWAGVIVLTGALFSGIFGLIKANSWGWTSTTILSLFAGSAILLAVFLGLEAYQKQPIIQLKLFKKPSFTAAQVAAVTLSASIFALFLYITLYLQDILRYTPLQTGLRFLPVTLTMFVVAAIAGRMTSKIPANFMIGGGLLIIAIGLVLLHGITLHAPWTNLLPGLVLAGFGIGLVNPSLANLAIGVVPPQESGMASGVNNTFRQVGIAGGVAMLGAIFQIKIQHTASLSLASAHLSSSQLKGITQAISSGSTQQVIQAAPRAYRPELTNITHSAFINGFNYLFWVTASIALVGALVSFMFIRKKDLAVYEPPKPA